MVGDFRPAQRRTRAAATAAAGSVMVALTLAIAVPAAAQPAAPPPAAAPQISRARDLYAAAEAAIADGRFDDAIRDYSAAHDLSRDPALLYKLGRAHERAGRCEAALGYYGRYLREGKPAPQFVATTRQRIAACGGHPPEREPAAAPSSSAPATPAAGAAPAPTAPPAEPVPAEPSPAEPSPGPAQLTAAALIPSNKHKVAWVMTGATIALATLGGVLAYASDSAENDIRDLYTGFLGRPPAFDPRTRDTYADLIDQGRRYERLAWASFGLAGAAAVSAAVLFVVGGKPSAEAAPAARPKAHSSVQITPIVTGATAGVWVRF